MIKKLALLTSRYKQADTGMMADRAGRENLLPK
jgi:hypothetical protein